VPGDIIIRRYVTSVTQEYDEIINPYFTHSALYMGNDELFEALGTNEAPVDQVKITKLSESDWLKPDMKNFIIYRPKNYYGKLDKITKNLRNIADDPEYVFGRLKEGEKTVSCSDIILKYLFDEGVIRISSPIPPLITPDYLFWAIEEDSSNFEVVGYDIQQKTLK
jgi:hypothetical protein